MYDILSGGFCTPFFIMNFANGSIDTIPPKYFSSFSQTRTCDDACEFQLTITYIPDTFDVGRPEIIHQLLLTSVNQDVMYKYGYYDSNGNIHEQDQWYKGMFTTYSESVEDGVLQYTISGVSAATQLSTQEIHITETKSCWLKPSSKFASLWDTHSSIMKHWDRDVDYSDEYVKSFDAFSGPLLDYVRGKVQSDGTTIGGLVSLSHKNTSLDSLLSMGYITESDVRTYENSKYSLSSYGATGDTRFQIQSTVNNINNLMVRKFICYIDNCFTGGIGGTDKYGTIHYKCLDIANVTDTYVYEYGNNIKNSQVLNFSCTYDGSVAMANVPATSRTSSDIDVDGNNIGSSNTATCSTGFGRNSYPTKSGFNEEVWLSNTTLLNSMIYPFEAELQILGQLTCSHLLDVIRVVVIINGTEHPVLSGTYTIKSITDELSESGFTTTLGLLRQTDDLSQLSSYEPTITTSGGASDAVQNTLDANY